MGDKTLTLSDTDVLLVVDVQNDFCPNGALAVPGGDEVVPIVNLLARTFRHTLLTQDWHPAGSPVLRLVATRATTPTDGD